MHVNLVPKIQKTLGTRLNAHQIRLHFECVFYSFLKEVQTKLAIYLPYMHA